MLTVSRSAVPGCVSRTARLKAGHLVFSEPLERRLLLISPELDFSFGAGGITTLDTFGSISDFRMLPGGKFMALGRASSSPPLTFLARFNGDGTLDRTFDG